MYQGKTKKILSHLSFLTQKYGFRFKFQTFEKWHDFYGPMDTYSFYNEFGCLTLHNAVQRGEWAIYLADKFSENQYELMKCEICQSDYMTKSYWTFNGWIKGLSQVIKKQIEKEGNLFGIILKEVGN